MSLGRSSLGNSQFSYVGMPIGEILMRMFGVPPAKINEALDGQAQRGGRLGEILVSLKVVKIEQVLQALALQLDTPYLENVLADEIPEDLVKKVAISFARQHLVVPLYRTEQNTIAVAMADPLDTEVQDQLRLLFGAEIDPVVAAPEAVRAAINRAYDRATNQAEDAVADLEESDYKEIGDASGGEPLDLIDGTDDAPIIRFVNTLFSQAAKDRASDIHIEPFERDLVVRFRVDGVLAEFFKPPKRVQSAIVGRIKIMAGLNIAEKRLPQDGRIRLKVAGRDIDVRVSTVPTVYGERIVMRLLDRSSVLRDLDTLGFSPPMLNALNQLINKSHGIILVTGPTGSGKTSTLYACLSKINSPDLNILTIEDPVEYQLKGIGQVQVNSKIDLTFANGLRAFLRQDPDVIMVGEIRDRETAEIAIQASLTGHLVLSTVHTNDAAGAATRLVEMKIEPFLVSSSLIGVLAQRLVRTICPHCKVEYKPTTDELKELGLDPNRVRRLWRGEGCPQCKNTGYKGRMGIYELLLVDDEIRQLILQNVDAGTIKNKARERGMIDLRQDGALKVMTGQTTIEEVSRVTQEDSMTFDSAA